MIKQEFVATTSQLDILIDIIIRDGHNLIKEDWFVYLYEKEIKSLKKKTNELIKQLESEKLEIDIQRKRDYLIYKACVNTAYFNDNVSNRDTKITNDELSILLTLSSELKLSQEEIKLINYIVIPPVKLEIEQVINDLKAIGLIFYSKKNRQVYVADEVVRVLRKIRKKQVADKFYRRFLKLLREPQAISAAELPAELLEKERDIVITQARESGKPEAIIEKMVDGRMKKFVNEISLLGQGFVKDHNS